MPWNNQGGGNEGGPWGGGSDGGKQWGNGGKQPGQPAPPDLDKLINDAKRRFGGFSKFSKGGGTGKLFWIFILIAAILWLLTGFYRVNAQQQGVVLRFGEWVRTTAPGLHYHLPFPIESVLRPEVTRDNRLEIGFREIAGRSNSKRDIADESQMITGDENIVDIDFVVFWRIADAGEYLFNLADPDDTIKVAAEAVMRETIGQTPIQTALTEGRQNIQINVKEKLQTLLDDYAAGIRVREVQLLAVDPPSDVIDAFNDVQRARQDRDRLKNEAEAFRNDVVPRARGEGARLIAESEAYLAEVVNRAKGDASRFNQVYNAYLKNKDITVERIYLETMEVMFRNVEKIIIDGDGGNGVVPYLPLKELNRTPGQGN